ncbi:DUF3854 domain-containing protein [bacterium]|nr:DUF3854 domain-containing protein [bacterium]
MNESHWINVDAARPCHHCGKTDWCSFSRDGKFEICRREGSPQAEYKCGTHGDYWLYSLNGESANAAPHYVQSTPPPESSQRAEPATLDRVYRALLNELTLTNPHRDNLAGRGLPPDEITRRMFRSWPGRGRAKICRTLLEQFDAAALAKIPGFYLKTPESGGDDTAPFWSLTGNAGIAIPVRDAERRIIALKIRADAPDANGVRYRWISSAKKDNGPGPGAPIHIPGIDDGIADYIAAGRPIRITEGELKADIATVLSGVLTISIPGVRNWRGAFAWLQSLEPKPPIKIAFDADAQTNRHVAESLHDLYGALVQNGYAVELELWETDVENGEPKGIDDALKAGASIAVYDGASVEPAIVEIEKAARAADPPALEVKTNAALDALDDFDKHAADPEWFDKSENLDALAMVREQRPSHWALKIKPVLKKHGMVREIEKLVDAHAASKQQTAAIIPFPQPTNGGGPASTAGDKPSESPETVLEEINKEYAVTSIGSNVLILRERFDPEQNRQEVDFLRRADFNLLFENRYVTTVNDSGEPHRENAATFWRRHPRRRSYKQVIFAPGVNEPQYFNLWRGFAVEPEPGDWGLFRDHIYNVICNGDASLFDYVLSWMANAVHNRGN